MIGTQTLLEAARRCEVERFHHVSTCEVYGDLPLDSDEAFTEDSPYLPRTPYNASKAGADHAVRAYFETYGLPVTITNCSNNYGPYQFPEKVIPLFVSNALDDQPLPLYASTQNRREWLHVLDHCRAIELVLERGEPGETYNVGSGVERSIEQIANAVLELTGKPATLKTIVPDRPGHDRRYLLDSTRIRERLGWRDEIAWEDGIAQTVQWYVDTATGGSRSASGRRSTKRPGASSPEALEAGAQAFAPVGQARGAFALAAEHRVRRARRRTAELLGRDLAHAAVQPSLLEDRAGELGPRALALGGDVPDAARQLEQLPRRLREMADVGRAADLVGDDAHLVALIARASSIVRTKFSPVQPKSHELRTIQPSRISRSPASFVLA